MSTTASTHPAPLPRHRYAADRPWACECLPHPRRRPAATHRLGTAPSKPGSPHPPLPQPHPPRPTCTERAMCVPSQRFEAHKLTDCEEGSWMQTVCHVRHERRSSMGHRPSCSRKKTIYRLKQYRSPARTVKRCSNTMVANYASNGGNPR